MYCGKNYMYVRFKPTMLPAIMFNFSDKCCKLCEVWATVLLLYVMQAFNFPADVSFSFGGPGSPRYFVNQIHYDNPNGVAGKRFVTIYYGIMHSTVHTYCRMHNSIIYLYALHSYTNPPPYNYVHTYIHNTIAFNIRLVICSPILGSWGCMTANSA